VGRLGLRVLISEMEQDASILRPSSENACLRVQEKHSGHLEACGYELHRFYNVFEKSLERLCLTFENHFEKKGDYHKRLLERLHLGITEVRPAIIPVSYKNILRELQEFRHVFRHAYDLELRQDRLLELTQHAQTIAKAFPHWVRAFESMVQADLEN